MAKENRIRLKRPWVIVIGIALVMLIGLGVFLVVHFAFPPEGADTPSGAVTEQEPRASSADLYCNEYTAYSGIFVEDGTNELVENVAAILVENRSKEFLDRATVTYDIGGETATFVVTGLPPGESAWVLEQNRMTLEGGVQFEFLDCESAFRQDAVLSTELLKVDTESNTITVTNTSDKVLKNVCLYYKNTHADGNYLGGITYMLSFDTLDGGKSAEKASAHFSDSSEIVRYSYQTE